MNSGLKSWHGFAFLIVAAAVWYYAKAPLIGAAVILGAVAAVGYCSLRFPATTHAILWLIAAFVGGGRRR